MPFDPWSLGTQVAGSVISSYAQGKQANSDRAAQREQDRQRLAEEQRQFNTKLAEDQRQYGGNYQQTQYKQNVDAQSQYGDRAQSVNRELEVLPMRDKAAALLMQRMGNPAVQTTARSLAGGGTDALRGGGLPQMPYDLNKQAQQAAAYKAGDGGMTGDVQKELLSRYMNVPKSPDMQAFTPQNTAPAVEKESDKIRAMLSSMDMQGVPRAIRQQVSKALEAALAREAQQSAGATR